MNKKLTVVASFQSHPGKEAELRTLLLGLVSPTLQEEGCINYDLHQSIEDPTKFLFYENWVSREHLDRHLQSEHIKVLLLRREELCMQPPEITFWEHV
ncbi:MAG TPA: putative quinol monooxygenase [Chthoniobacterales bacterium]|nr:putative quinol monooxygenase [Chthoniobacterales bacterium]